MDNLLFTIVTDPFKIEFEELCPATETLDETTFSVSINILDQFGSPVTGNMLINNSLSIQANSSCLTNSPVSTPVDAYVGEAIFSDLNLHGKNNNSCSISFSTMSSLDLHIKRQSCSVLLYGCPDGYRIQTGSPYDSCKEGKFQFRIFYFW